MKKKSKWETTRDSERSDNQHLFSTFWKGRGRGKNKNEQHKG